jgi:SH3-like domain-containing protein
MSIGKLFVVRALFISIGAFSMLVVNFTSQCLAETYRVYGVQNWDKLNIRSKPSKRGRIVGAIPPSGRGVVIIGQCRGTWCPIQYRDMTGWVSNRYLVRDAPESAPLRVVGIANWDVLYIRSKPSTRGQKIGSIPPHGRGVRKLGPCKGNWCRIAYQGTVGWASMMYLIPDTAATPSGDMDAPVVPNAPPPQDDDLMEGLEDLE